MKYTTLKKLEDGSYYSSISTDWIKPLIVQVNNVTVSEGTLDGTMMYGSTLGKVKANYVCPTKTKFSQKSRVIPRNGSTRRFVKKRSNPVGNHICPSTVHSRSPSPKC